MGLRPSIWAGLPDDGRGWTEPERRLLRALAVAERWDCPRCGGDLRHELTDSPPWDDEADHGHRMHTAWCRGCVAKIRHDRRQRKQQEKDEGTFFDAFPEAQVTIPERIPLPGR